MSLPYWVETLRTVPSRQDGRPGSLLPHVGVEYNFPYVTPLLVTNVSLRTTNRVVGDRGLSGSAVVFDTYATCYFKLCFLNIVPDTIKLTAYLQNSIVFECIVTGTQIEQGIDYMQWLFAGDEMVLKIENLTNMNQAFGFVSQYIICKSEADYILARDTLEWIKFPAYNIKEVGK